jgi:hypothetical protein
VCCCQWCWVRVVAVMVPARRVARCVHCYEDVVYKYPKHVGEILIIFSINKPPLLHLVGISSSLLSILRYTYIFSFYH